jgi:hypothetical protein
VKLPNDNPPDIPDMLKLSFSYMQEDNFSMSGISGGLSFGNFTWTFEADQAENWIEVIPLWRCMMKLSGKSSRGFI